MNDRATLPAARNDHSRDHQGSRLPRLGAREMPIDEREGDFEEELEEAEEEEYRDPEAAATPPPVSVVSSRVEREPEDRATSEMTVDEILARAKATRDYDIFQDVGAVLAEREDRVTYSIRKNNEHQGTVPHPFSYDEIQDRWGGGSYVITLRSALFSKKPGGGYLLSQPKLIANKVPDRVASAADPGKGSSNMELLATLQAMNEKQRAEAKAELDRIREESRLREERLEREFRAREERLEKESREREIAREKEIRERESARKEESNSSMTMMLKLMEQNAQTARDAAKQQSDMMIAMFSSKKEEKSDDKKSDKLFDMLLGMLVDKKSKSDGIDAVGLTKLIMDAQEKGESKAEKFREMVREEAKRLSANPRASRDDEEEEDEPREESTTQSILKALVPMAAQAFSGAMNAPSPAPVARVAPPLPPQRMIARPGVNPHAPARVLPQPVRPLAPLPPRSVAPRVPQAQPATPPRAAMPQPQPQPPRPAVRDGQSAPAATASAPLQGATPMPKNPKEVVQSIVMQEIGTNLISGDFKPEETAAKCLAMLKASAPEIDAKWLLANFTLDEMKQIAKANGIPDAVHPYLEKFHDHVAKTAQG